MVRVLFLFIVLFAGVHAYFLRGGITARRWGWVYRRNRYGISLSEMWPHISIGLSAHVSTRFAHLTFHTPSGYVILGCIGADDAI